MYTHFPGIIDSLINHFDRPRIIRRIDNGHTVDGVTARSLRNLPERILRDVGFTSSD